MNRLCVFVNGIMNFPGQSSNWTGRAVTYTMTQKKWHAEKVEYLSFATFHRLLGQRNRVKKFARTLSFYMGGDWDITVAAHSNGCAVALEGLRYLEWPKIRSLHLFSPACSRDFRKLGLRTAQVAKEIGHTFIYIGGRDVPLRLASSYFGRLFGYGSLGKDGPVGQLEADTTVIKRADWGHSDWWLDSNLPWTMERILE